MILPTVLDAPPVEEAVEYDLDNHYEIIGGKRVELPPMSINSGRLASRLARKLGDFAEQHDLGEVNTEVLFDIPLPGVRNRRPDLTFVSYKKWPKNRDAPEEQDAAWDVVPDLAVEVTSPSDKAEELMSKIFDYFESGVRLVWVIYPRQRFVMVYESLTRLRGLTRADDLDGGEVLPNFRLPLAQLFYETPRGT